MNRAIAILSLVGLLSAGFLLASESTPPAGWSTPPAGPAETAGLCAASSPTAPELVFLQDGCAVFFACPDGDNVGCLLPSGSDCATLTHCTGGFACGARCGSTRRYCAGYSGTNCKC
jgi:hypothetical protein